MLFSASYCFVIGGKVFDALSLSFPSITDLCVPEVREGLEGEPQILTLTGGHSGKVGMDILSLNSNGE